MTDQPRTDEPRMFGSTLEPQRLPWAWAVERLVDAHIYWIATTRPDGRPHARPVWAVWCGDEGALSFSTGSLAASNLAANPAITVHLETDPEVVILEGTAAAISDRSELQTVLDAYNPKYGEEVTVDTIPGPFLRVALERAFGWIAADDASDGGAQFHGTATRWIF